MITCHNDPNCGHIFSNFFLSFGTWFCSNNSILNTKMYRAGIMQSLVFATLTVDFSMWTALLQTAVSSDPSDMQFSVMKTDERISTRESTVRIQYKILQEVLSWCFRVSAGSQVWARKQFVPPWFKIWCWKFSKAIPLCSSRTCSWKVQWLAIWQIRAVFSGSWHNRWRCVQRLKYIQYEYRTVYAMWQTETEQDCKNCREGAFQRADFQLSVLGTDHCSLGFHLSKPQHPWD